MSAARNVHRESSQQASCRWTMAIGSVAPALLLFLLIGCRTSPQMPADAFDQMFKTNSELLAPALMSPQTRAEADALMRPKLPLPPMSKTLTSRVVTHPPPVAITNVTVTWNLEPMPAILQSIQGPAGNVHAVTFLVASTNGWRSQYQVTPDMLYAPSNGIVRRMLSSEQLRSAYGWKP